MARMTGEDIATALTDLPGWIHDGKATLNSIRKTFKFKDFTAAWAFMNAVAVLAEDMDHHPEWSNVYNRVDIMLTTHAVGGVSEKDITLANAIEKTVLK